VEYIVIDGGSQDETVSILQHYTEHINWVSEPDEGQADAINKGIKQARGQILAYLNSDDYYLPGTLTRVALQFRENPHVSLFYGDCLAVWEDGSEKGLIKGHPFNLKNIIQKGEFIPQQAAFWTRAATEKAGVFDKTLHFAMDYDYFIRLGMVSICSPHQISFSGRASLAGGSIG
jgi:glycosyltransferase involved in cell wall biosynthesis